MDALREINHMVKSAQVWGYFAPAHDPKAAKNFKDQSVAALKPVVSAVKSVMPKVYTLDDTAKKYADRYFVSDPYYHNILVGGANAGGSGIKGLSSLPFGVLAKGDNKALFRNGEIDKIKKEIVGALEAGKHPRVIGHSWGGADVANLAKYFPGVPFIALDPVSWKNNIEKSPDNLTVFLPEDTSIKGTLRQDGENLTSRLAPIFGHRWNAPEGNVVRYKGGHVVGLNNAITQYMIEKWKERDPENFHKYYDKDGNRLPYMTSDSGSNTKHDIPVAKTP